MSSGATEKSRNSGTSILCMYTESKTRVRRPLGCSDYFEIKIGVRQGSALGPLLFITVIEEATKNSLHGTMQYA